MIRALILITALGSLSACAQYREPQATCFSFVSHSPTSSNCEFTPLPGSEARGEEYD